MTVTTITTNLIKNPPPIPAGKRKVRVHCDRVRGFSVEIRPTGGTFLFRYFDARKRERTIRLGRFGDVTVSQARKRAEELRAEVSLGRDPSAERRQRATEPTVKRLIEDFYLPHVRPELRSIKNTELYCRRIIAAMGDKTVSEVTVVDVNSFRQGLLATGLSRRTCDLHLATLRALYNVSRKQGVYAGPNPAANPGMAPVACRTGYLTASNVQAFHQALALEPCPSAAAALLLLLYTGGRKNEILTAKWADIDLERHLITVPVARSKTKRARYISLTPHAEEIILAQSRRRQADNPFVFPSDRNPGRPLADLRGPWSRAKAAANLPPDSVIHTLRHSFGSALASEGVPLNEIAELLGHSQLATTMRYAHLSPERLTDTASIAAKAWGMPATNERNVE